MSLGHAESSPRVAVYKTESATWIRQEVYTRVKDGEVTRAGTMSIDRGPSR